MTASTAHHVIFYSCSLVLSFLLFFFTSDCPTACNNPFVYQLRNCVCCHLIYVIYHGLFLFSFYTSK